MSLIKQLESYQFPICQEHNQNIDRICFDKNCKLFFQVTCLDCMYDFHDHKIQQVPKIQFVLKSLIFQINQNLDNDLQKNQKISQNSSYNYPIYQTQSRLEKLVQQFQQSKQLNFDNYQQEQQKQNIAQNLIDIGQELKNLGQFTNHISQDTSEIMQQKQLMANSQDIQQILHEIFKFPLNKDQLQKGLKQIKNYAYVIQFQNNDKKLTQKKTQHQQQQQQLVLKIKQSNTFFDLEDFQKNIQQINNIQQQIFQKLQQKLDQNDTSSSNSQFQEINNKNNNNKNQQIAQEQQDNQQQEHFINEKFQKIKLEEWKKCLKKAHNNCLRYPNQGESTCLILYNQPGYCDNCQMILDIYQQNIEQLKSKIKI